MSHGLDDLLRRFGGRANSEELKRPKVRELFCLSSRLPTRATLSLERFAQHGGYCSRAIDGWGLTFFVMGAMYGCSKSRSDSGQADQLGYASLLCNMLRPATSRWSGIGELSSASRPYRPPDSALIFPESRPSNVRDGPSPCNAHPLEIDIQSNSNDIIVLKPEPLIRTRRDLIVIDDEPRAVQQFVEGYNFRLPDIAPK